jgi:hypothetical protein
MRNPLAKLNQMAGKKYYFVQSQAMAQRAETKINRNGWKVRVIQLMPPNIVLQPTAAGAMLSRRG